MFCTECGQQLPETAKFCSSCGLATNILPGPADDKARSDLALTDLAREVLKDAEAGDTDAMFEFALWCSEQGNEEQAEYWFLKLFETGDYFAAYELGKLYATKDDAKSEEWFLKASEEMSEPYLAEALGDLYARKGMKSEAQKWYHTALELLDGPGGEDYTEEEIVRLRRKVDTGYEKTNEYEFYIFRNSDDVWVFEPREYFLDDDGEWGEDEYQIRSDLSDRLSEEEAAYMDFPATLEKIHYADNVMSDTGYIKSFYNPPQSVLDYLDNLPEYPVEPRS